MKRLTLLGAVNSYTSFGALTEGFTRGIEKLTGAHVSIRALATSEAFGSKVPADIRARFVSGPQPEEWEFLIHPPDFAPTPGKRTIAFSMWESTRLAPMAVDILNRMEAVIVPCAWCASCFSASGVDRPIRIVPLGINTDVFRYRPVPETIKDICVFGCAGRMAHGGVRKGINEVIELFERAFPCEMDVRLKVKCWPDCQVDKIRDPRVQVTQAYLTEEAMGDWFNEIHCFVSAARGEAWGLMQNQGMAIGRPVITINFGGLQEFFQPELGYAVDYKLAPAKGAYTGMGHWAEPSEQGMIDAMREVYSNRAKAIHKGMAAATHVRHLSLENSHRQLVKVLEEFGAL